MVLAEHRADLLGVLARRAEALTEKRRFVARRWVAVRTPWPVVEAACFVAARRGWAGARTVEPGDTKTPSWALDIAVASNLGRGRKGQLRGAGKRLRALLVIAGRLVAWRGGLRLEELALMLGAPEERVWFYLQWARREGVFVDLGDRGWFLDTRDGTGPGSVAVLRRRAA